MALSLRATRDGRWIYCPDEIACGYRRLQPGVSYAATGWARETKSPSQHHTAPAHLASKPGKHLLEHNIVNQDLLLVQNDREAKLLVQTKYLFILSPPPPPPTEGRDKNTFRWRAIPTTGSLAHKASLPRKRRQEESRPYSSQPESCEVSLGSVSLVVTLLQPSRKAMTRIESTKVLSARSGFVDVVDSAPLRV